MQPDLQASLETLAWSWGHMQTAARVAVSRLRLVLEAETASQQTLELTRTVGSLLPESSSMIGDARIIRDLGGPCTRMRLERIAEPTYS